ncbi:sulfotransferase 1A1-like isoform X2 [Pomacea canaliculata]|nr:sulfotransferase 1A1-like isoform X2 [Pomacea canaliculata]XP_025092793.1 sulfotransferase 1A1-like isoform X2 [Pomacea canaliculata]
MNEKSNGPENIRTFLVKDQVLPPQPFGLDWEQQVVNIQSMKVRDDDLIICAYPKAGTHWLWEMCHMLLHGRVEYETRAKEHLMMEFVSKDALANDDSPRIFNTHLYFSLFMTEKMKEKKVKLVHVYRNPKDTVMSLYFHYRQLLWHSQDLREFVQEFLRGEVSFGDYVRYLQQMETFMKENPDHPVVNVSFEETKRDPVGVVRRLAELMKVDASEKLCEDIVAACSFQKMKMVDDTLKQYLQTPLITFSQKLYRKGVVGDWKNYLTVAESEMIDKLYCGRTERLHSL